MNAVELRNVTKTFGPHVAVDDLSLDVPQGTIYGFIGPNGSGKTTTLRMIMRIIHPDRGQISVLGEPAHRGGAAHDRVAYLPEERGLYKQMRVRDLLYFYAQLKGYRATRFEIDEWLQRLFPDQGSRVGDLKVEQLSKGMSQKVQYISAVIAKPRLVLLDEPFSGLDPTNEDVLRQAVLDLRKAGSTVIFSTHNMATAEKMCDFVFMIYRGRKVLDGTLESIQRTYGADVVRVRFDGNGDAGSAEQRLDGLPGILAVMDFGRFQELRLSPDADRQQLLAALMSRGPVAHFEQAHPSLEDIFRRIASPDAADLDPSIPVNEESALA